jgi:hypothetical protein
MSLFSSRALSSYGYLGLAFGEGGQNVLFGPFAFSAPYSYRDFMGTEHFLGKVKQYTPLTWSPPSTVILSRAAQVWAVWQAAADAGSPTAVTFVKNTTQKLNEFIARVDPLAYQQDMFGNFPVDTDLQRYELFRLIKDRVLAVANSSAAATAAYNAVMPSGGSSSSDLPDLTKSASTAGGGTAGGAAGGAAATDNTLLYAGLGLGAVALLAGVVYLSKRRSSVSGYRRRGRKR